MCLVLDVFVGFLVVVVVGLLFAVVCFLLRHWIRFVQVRHSLSIWVESWWFLSCPVLWMQVAMLMCGCWFGISVVGGFRVWWVFVCGFSWG